jgi:hypothetical protein
VRKLVALRTVLEEIKKMFDGIATTNRPNPQDSFQSVTCSSADHSCVIRKNDGSASFHFPITPRMNFGHVNNQAVWQIAICEVALPKRIRTLQGALNYIDFAIVFDGLMHKGRVILQHEYMLAPQELMNVYARAVQNGAHPFLASLQGTLSQPFNITWPGPLGRAELEVKVAKAADSAMITLSPALCAVLGWVCQAHRNLTYSYFYRFRNYQFVGPSKSEAQAPFDPYGNQRTVHVDCGRIAPDTFSGNTEVNPDLNLLSMLNVYDDNPSNAADVYKLCKQRYDVFLQAIY